MNKLTRNIILCLIVGIVVVFYGIYSSTDLATTILLLFVFIGLGIEIVVTIFSTIFTGVLLIFIGWMTYILLFKKNNKLN
ncbi:hypothetical protein [Defluviitalea phaphyphila]|uniref:hypothetical protein n=1 Tax=Defluviitalea phaphyphila TaxID=1473580 RepID=UPI000730109A|nr:hypothetical protein [Defluviitalea phaphyphila]